MVCCVCLQTGCLTLFSTHYHMLSELLDSDPNISMYHMVNSHRSTTVITSKPTRMRFGFMQACAVKPNEKKDAVPEVTFLYKLTNGICPKSFGMNVALMAGLPVCFPFVSSLYQAVCLAERV